MLNNSKPQWNKIIFDMDGVITRESMYWDTAALTVYELLFKKRDVSVEDFQTVHDTIFRGRDMINALKNRGVNTNWDLALVTYCISLHINPSLQTLDAEHFNKVVDFAQNMPKTATEVYDMSYDLAAKATGKNAAYFARERSEFWTELQDVFDSWFMGEGLFEMEHPVVPLDEMRELFERLTNSGITLGIGTGRPLDQLLRPLQMWDIEKYFDKSAIGSYTDVVNAEIACGSKVSLAKPHPYVFLKAAAGGKYTDEQILEMCKTPTPRGAKVDVGENLAREKAALSLTDGVLVVGDAVADFVSARDGGFAFAATLTGVSGADTRGYFEENNAEYIFNDVLGLNQLI